jgi:hypothetical protein
LWVIPALAFFITLELGDITTVSAVLDSLSLVVETLTFVCFVVGRMAAAGVRSGRRVLLLRAVAVRESLIVLSVVTTFIFGISRLLTPAAADKFSLSADGLVDEIEMVAAEVLTVFDTFDQRANTFSVDVVLRIGEIGVSAAVFILFGCCLTIAGTVTLSLFLKFGFHKRDVGTASITLSSDGSGVLAVA